MSTVFLTPQPEPGGLSVARKRTDKPDDSKKRTRARDTGEVVALGVEISADLFRVFEELREENLWSKRVLVEQALKAFFASKGRWPLPGGKGAR